MGTNHNYIEQTVVKVTQHPTVEMKLMNVKWTQLAFPPWQSFSSQGFLHPTAPSCNATPALTVLLTPWTLSIISPSALTTAMSHASPPSPSLPTIGVSVVRVVRSQDFQHNHSGIQN